MTKFLSISNIWCLPRRTVALAGVLHLIYSDKSVTSWDGVLSIHGSTDSQHSGGNSGSQVSGTGGGLGGCIFYYNPVLLVANLFLPLLALALSDQCGFLLLSVGQVDTGRTFVIRESSQGNFTISAVVVLHEFGCGGHIRFPWHSIDEGLACFSLLNLCVPTIHLPI